MFDNLQKKQYLYIIKEHTNPNKMEDIKFSVRCYDKVELAKMYFPKLSNPVSVAKLRRWMRNCIPLMEELTAGDFHPKLKMFSAREVRLIVRFLGEPDGYTTASEENRNYRPFN